MHPVREVDVEVPAFSEHHLVALGFAPIGVRGGIPFTVRLGFNYFADQRCPAELANEILAKKVPCNERGGTEIELAGKLLEFSIGDF